MYRYVVVSGTIGAGKTELAKRIAGYLNGKIILEEFATNTFLEKFYADPDRYAFPLEISFLFERFQQLNIEFSRADIFKNFYISDYFFDKSLLFGKINLTDDQFNVFRSLFTVFLEQVAKPDLIIYLHRPVSELLRNIKNRGNDFEMYIKFEYLDSVQKAYFSYFKSLNNSKIVIVDLKDRDFTNDLDLLNSLVGLVGQEHEVGMKLVEV